MYITFVEPFRIKNVHSELCWNLAASNVEDIIRATSFCRDVFRLQDNLKLFPGSIPCVNQITDADLGQINFMYYSLHGSLLQDLQSDIKEFIKIS